MYLYKCYDGLRYSMPDWCMTAKPVNSKHQHLNLIHLNALAEALYASLKEAEATFDQAREGIP